MTRLCACGCNQPLVVVKRGKTRLYRPECKKAHEYRREKARLLVEGPKARPAPRQKLCKSCFNTGRDCAVCALSEKATR